MGLLKLFNIYLNQAGEFSTYLSLNFPNLYTILSGKDDMLVFSHMGIVLAVSICGLLLVYCLSKKIKMTKENILNLGLLSIMLTTFFLPCMHERYLYMGEVLSVLVFLSYKKNLFVPFVLQTISLITYSNYLFKEAFPNSLPFLSIAYAITIAVYAKRLSDTCEKELPEEIKS
jgi:hypothetical protein